ncbi:hypothetical protein [Paracoccus sp. DMF]|nr:hypothetical protein [Paracoccus sp. DMF]
MDLAAAPTMLRSIIESAVAEMSDAEVVRLPSDGPFDAVLVCMETPDPQALPAVQADRFVVVPRRGDRLWILTTGKVQRTMEDVSTATIRACLRQGPSEVS